MGGWFNSHNDNSRSITIPADKRYLVVQFFGGSAVNNWDPGTYEVF